MTEAQLLATGQGSPRPATLDALLERYEPEVIDLPRGRARIRLEIRSQDSWEAVLDGDRPTLESAHGTPDASISGDAATWAAIARDLRGGMGAFKRGRL